MLVFWKQHLTYQTVSEILGGLCLPPYNKSTVDKSQQDVPVTKSSVLKGKKRDEERKGKHCLYLIKISNSRNVIFSCFSQDRTIVGNYN